LNPLPGVPSVRLRRLSCQHANATFDNIKVDDFEILGGAPFLYLFGRMTMRMKRVIPIEIRDAVHVPVESLIPVTSQYVPINEPLEVIGPSLYLKYGDFFRELYLYISVPTALCLSK
jgi:hypothetical protein